MEGLIFGTLRYALLTELVLVKMAWILAKFFFFVFMDRDKMEVNKNATKKVTKIQPS